MLVCLAASPFNSLGAQRVLGALDDATVVPRGTFRVSAGISFSRADERFASGRPGGAARGEREPLGFAFDMLGPETIEALAPVTQPLRSLSGQSALALSLGALRVSMNHDVRTIPFSLEAGLTSRLSVGVLVRYVFVRNDVAVVPGAGGNLGLNPAVSPTATAARTRNGTVISQIFAASARLRAQLAACQADPSGPGCAALNANRPAALAFLSQTDVAAADLMAVYGDASRAGSRFAPIVGSALEQAIFGRLSAFNASYQSFLGLPVDSVLVSARPVGATRLTLNDVTSILSDSAFGIAAAPLESVEHGHLGDIEVGAKLLLYDSFQGRTSRRLARSPGVNVRLAVGAAYRFANGMKAAPNSFADLGTGDGSPDIEGRGYFDLVIGDRFWWSAVVRYGVPREDTVTVRIADPGTSSFPPAYREKNVTRTPGKYLEAEWSPRFVLNDFFALAGYYRYRRTDADQYAGVFTVTDLSGNTRTLDAATLGAFANTEEHRAGLALSYSTVASYAGRRAAVPLELTLLLSRVVSGAGVPDASHVTLTARWYHKIFGANNLRR